MSNGGYYIWISLAIAAIFIFLAMTRVARIRQQRLQATRRANQVLPYSQADISPVFPTTLWASRHFGAAGRNEVVRVESRDSQLPSYNAPAISVPPTAYDPSLAVPISPVSYSLRPESDMSLPPAYVQQPLEHPERTVKSEETAAGVVANGGLPAYR